MIENQESIQLLNTAIIKSKEKDLNGSYEDRLTKICNTSAIKVLSQAISLLSEQDNISRDQAAMQIVQTVRSLDQIWQDYVMMEGISKLKDILQGKSPLN